MGYTDAIPSQRGARIACFIAFGIAHAWLSPGYAAKCFGPELNIYLRDQPCIAGLVMQSSWIVLALVPEFSAKDGSADDSSSPAQASRSNICCLALKFGFPLGALV